VADPGTGWRIGGAKKSIYVSPSCNTIRLICMHFVGYYVALVNLLWLECSHMTLQYKIYTSCNRMQWWGLGCVGRKEIFPASPVCHHRVYECLRETNRSLSNSGQCLSRRRRRWVSFRITKSHGTKLRVKF